MPTPLAPILASNLQVNVQQSVTLSRFGFTDITPSMLQNVGPAHLRLANYSSFVLLMVFASGSSFYLGPMESIIYPLQVADTNFSYTPISETLATTGFSTIIGTYYAPGESVMPVEPLTPANSSFVTFLPTLGGGNVEINVPAAGAVSNFGSPFQVILGTLYTIFASQIVLQWNGQGAAAGGINFQIGVDLQTVGNVSVGGFFPTYFFRYNCDWPAVAGPYSGANVSYPLPYQITQSIPSGTAHHFTLVFKTVAKTNAPIAVDLNVLAGVQTGQTYQGYFS